MCLAEAAQSVAELGICHAARGPPPPGGWRSGDTWCEMNGLIEQMIPYGLDPI